jgi:hypothetical protein
MRRLLSLLAAVALASTLAACVDDAAEQERLMAWLSCDECTDGELAFVVDTLGQRAQPALRRALLGSLEDYTANVEAIAGAEWSATPGMVGDSATFVDSIVANVRATVQRRATIGLGALGDTATLREAYNTTPLVPYRANVLLLIEESLAGSGAPGFAPRVVSSILVRPATLTLAPGGSDALEAIVRDAGGVPLVRALAWASSDPVLVSVASPVPARGVVTAPGVGTGSATITVTAPGGVTGTAVVDVVTPPPPVGSIAILSGDAQVDTAGTPLDAPLVVFVTDGLGTELSGVTVDWTVEQPGGGTAYYNTLTDSFGRASLTFGLTATPGRILVTASAGAFGAVRFQLRSVTP